MRAVRFLPLGLPLLLLSVNPGLTQWEGRGSGTSKRMEPDQLFNMLSGGREVVERSQVDPRMQPMFDRVAERMNNTSGRITREEFTNSMRERKGSNGGAGAPPTGPSGVPLAPPGSGQSRSAAGGPDDTTAMAESAFRRFDRNGDGYLNSDEMPEDLRAEVSKWDTDGNGLIDLNEFKAFFQAKMNQMAGQYPQPSPTSWPTQIIPTVVKGATAQPPPKEPLVYRSSNLPKELPPWFAQLDTNHDAQIGLYEWKASGRSLDEFRRMDRNGDGFLTVEEVLFYEAQKREKAGGATSQVVVKGTASPVIRSQPVSRPVSTGAGGPNPVGVDGGRSKAALSTDASKWRDLSERRRRDQPTIQAR